MAVGIDSAGYEAYFKELYEDIGIEMLITKSMTGGLSRQELIQRRK